MTSSRTNGFLSMFETLRKRTLMLTQQLPRFPSMVISADSIEPQGDFAEAQAQFLEPDSAQVDQLVQVRDRLSSTTSCCEVHFGCVALVAFVGQACLLALSLAGCRDAGGWQQTA